MTAAIGRFPLVEPDCGRGADAVDCSRDQPARALDGVLNICGVLVLTLSPDLVISTRSSSESLATPLVLAGTEVSFFVCSSHLPSG